jgi:hypothetical protein
MSARQYLAAQHIVVRPDGREHSWTASWKDKGWQREVALELSHFMSLLAILPGSDLIATVPDDIATVLARHIAIRRIELPFKPPQAGRAAVLAPPHAERRGQPWLRGLFYEVNRRDANARLPDWRSRLEQRASAVDQARGLHAGDADRLVLVAVPPLAPTAPSTLADGILDHDRARLRQELALGVAASATKKFGLSLARSASCGWTRPCPPRPRPWRARRRSGTCSRRPRWRRP